MNEINGLAQTLFSISDSETDEANDNDDDNDDNDDDYDDDDVEYQEEPVHFTNKQDVKNAMTNLEHGKKISKKTLKMTQNTSSLSHKLCWMIIK